MTPIQLDAYIQELITFDPTLKEKEDLLRKHLQEFADAKDSIVVSEEFIRSLRVALFDAATTPTVSWFHTIIQYIYMHTKHITLGTAGVIATLAITIGAYTFFTQTTPRSLVIDTGSDSQALALGPDAFGSFTVQEQGVSVAAPISEAMLSSRSVINPSVGFGGGGMTATEDVAVEGKMMIMPYYQYVYEYVGDTIELPTDLPVYRRAIHGSQATTAATIIRSIDNGMITIPNGLMAENVSLRSQERNGYSYNIDFANEQVSMYEESNIYDEKWNEARALSESEILNIATKFLNAQGVSLDVYSAPVLDTQYLRYQGEFPQVPQYLSVIFPLITPSGEMVYTQSGETPVGISVTVDQSRRKVTSVWNIKRTKFESSAYELASDIDRILAVAAQGGSVYEPWYPEDAEKNMFELGTPTVVYIEYYKYNESTASNDELYIPALRFPIVSAPNKDVYYTPTYVTVPLIASLLEAPEETDTDRPIPRPLPVEPLYSDGEVIAL